MYNVYHNHLQPKVLWHRCLRAMHLTLPSWGARQLTKGEVASLTEFGQMRIGSSNGTNYFGYTANNQFASKRNQLQAWTNDATLTPISSCAPRLSRTLKL